MSSQGFQLLTDWFGLASLAAYDGKLRVVSSGSGDNKQRVCVANATWGGGTQTGGAGRYSAGVNATGTVWRNPTVTYQVVKDLTFNVSLGKGYAAVNTAYEKPTISGYMITDVKIDTAIGKFPLITVSAVANEGYVQSMSGTTRRWSVAATDAVNLFAVSVPVLGRARAQNLLNAVTNGGQLQSCSLHATCSPVVLAEDLLPCASDVVQGKLVVEATTFAPEAENAPTAGNGFSALGMPKSCGDRDYLSWKFRAEKEIG